MEGSRVVASVSVIVPCYNYGRYLPGCVASILSQDGVIVDVRILDDSSADGSGEIASAIAEQDSRVSVTRHEVNRGHIATYNEGLGQAKGDYVVLLSADDLLTPGALARATSVMEAYPSVGLVYGHPMSFCGLDVPCARVRVRSWSVWRGDEWIAAQCRRGLSCIYSPEVVVRTRVQAAVGGYTAELPHTADLEMWLRIAGVSDVGRVNGPTQALRRLHETSMMHTRFGSIADDIRERKRAYERFFEGPGIAIPNGLYCLNTALCGLAEEAIGTACDVVMSEGEGRKVDELVELARDMVGSLESIRGWRELGRLRIGSMTRWDWVLFRGYALRRDIVGRIRWRRWMWSGV